MRKLYSVGGFNRFMVAILCTFVLGLSVHGQNISNYTFSTGTSGSLVDMSSGTTEISVGATGTYRDDNASTVITLPFTFYFMSTGYDRISVNSNGQLKLGNATNSSALTGSSYTGPSSGNAILAPISGDNGVLATGKVHYKVTGSPGSYFFVVEWSDLRIPHLSGGGGTGSTVQLTIDEATGVIEYIYGTMYNNGTSSTTRSVGISSSNTATTSAYIATITGTPTFTPSSSWSTSSFALSSAMTNLNSASDGSRRTFTFTPIGNSAAANPTTLTFSSVVSSNFKMNWVDNSTSETYFIVTRATDAAFTQNVVTNIVNSTTTAATGGAYNFTQTGLTASTTYFVKVQAANEAFATSAGITGSQATTAGQTFTSVVTGNWNTAATWDLNALPGADDNIVVSVGHTVTADVSSLSVLNATVSGTLACGSTPASFTILNNLIVNVGGTVNVFNGTTGKTMFVGGNLTNNGTVNISVGATTAGNLTLNGTGVQTVSGTGTFTSSVIRNLTCSNTSTAIPNIIWSFNNIKIAYNLNVTGARINLGSNKLTFGNSAAGNTLTAPVGSGFLAGGKFARWWTTTATGSAVTAGADPTTTTSRYPFVSATGRSRIMYITRSSSSATGNTAGELAVVYTDATTTTTGLSIADGAYTITDRYDANWTITAESGYVYASGTHTLVLTAENSLYPLNGNVRVMTSAAAAAGAHQNGSTTPGAQRTGLTTANLTAAGGYYIGINTADISYVSVTNGNWNSGATWNRGTVPTCTDQVYISEGTTVTVNSAGNVAKNVNVVAGANLTVASGDLVVGCTANNNTLSSVGTLTISGGTLSVNGSVSITSGEFNMTGGDFNIDPNSNASATSVAAGTRVLTVDGSVTGTVNGGTITIVDPHFDLATTQTFGFTGSVSRSWAGNTLRLGNGTSTDASSSTRGFELDTWAASGRLTLGNVVVNGGSGTNRFTASANSTLNGTFIGNLTVNSGSEFVNTTATNFYISGNITNNGTLTVPNTLILQNADASAGTGAQVISGTGTFRNASTSPTASIASLGINNAHATGVTLSIPVSVSGTLTLTAGFVNTTSVNLLTLGTATAAGTLSGGSATAYIKGPFARTFAASRTASGTYSQATLYPVGKTAYLPIYIDPTTSVGGPVVFSGEAFTTNAGTEGGGVVGGTLSQNRWEALPITGAANLTSSNIRIGATSIAATNKIVQAPTAAGAYGPIIPGTAYAAGTPNTLTTTGTQILQADYTGYFSYSDLNLCTTPADQPTAFVASNVGATAFNGSFTAAASAPSHYLVVRYLGGATPTAPADYTVYTAGGVIGAGTVAAVLIAPTTSFSATGLTAGTTYDYYVYSYNNSGCYGPIYNSTAPLTGTVVTCAAAVTAPSALAQTTYLTNGFTVTWTAPATPTLEMDIATNSTFTNFVAGYNAKALAAGTTSEIVTGLTPGTEYWIRLRAVDGGCYSLNSSALRAVTVCTPVTSFFENFDGGAAPTLPVCWIKTGTSGTVQLQNTNSNSSPNTMYIYSSTTSNIAIVSLPPVSNLGAGTHRLRFNMRANVTANGVIQVGYITTAGNPGTFTAIQSVTAATLTYQEYIVTPGVIATSAEMFAFRHTGDPANSILIDDVRWEPIPAPTITNFTSTVVCGASTLLTVTGTNLQNSTVTIGGTSITPSSITSTEIVATISTSLSGTIAVTTTGGTANSATPFAFTVAPALTLSNSSVETCNGSASAPVTITAGAGDYDTYVWAPATNVAGNAAAGWTFSPTSATVYTVTASQSAGSCSRTWAVSVVVNPVPTAVTVTPATQTLCVGVVQQLTASGSTVAARTILSENFNGVTAGTTTSGALPAGWTGSSLTAGNRIWGVVASAQSSNTLGGGNFLYCESDGYSTNQTRSEVITPVFDASNYSAATIKFRQYFNDVGAGAATDSARVYISNDGGANWTLIQQYDSDQGTAFTLAGAVQASIAIPGSVPLTNNMKVKLLYNSDAGGNDWYWAVDDFIVEGNQILSYTWSPQTELYTDAAATTAYTGGATTSVYAKPTTSRIYTATVSTTSSCSNTGTANITVDPATVAGSLNGDQSICTGTQPADLVLSGQTGNVVRWESSADAAFTSPTTIASTATTLTGATIGALTTSTYYRAVVKSGVCAEANTAAVLVTVSPTTVAGTVSADQTICSGTQPADLVLAGNTGSVVKWQKSADAAFTTPTDIASTSTTLTGAVIGNVSSNTYFRAVVQSGACAPANTAAILVTVDAPSVGGTVSGTQTVCSGSQPTTDLVLSGNTGNVVKWQKSTDAAFTSPTDISSTSTTLTGAVIGNLSVSTYFRAVVKNGNCTEANSASVLITVNTSGGGTLSGDQTICAGTQPGTDLVLTGNSGSVLKWQKSTDAAFTSPVDIASTATTLTGAVIGNLSQNTYFRAVVQSGTCASVNSNSVLVTVTPLAVGGTVAGTQTVCIGNAPSTDLVLSGHTGNVVKWQKSADAAFTSPVDIVSTSATLTGATIGTLTQTTYFRAVVQSGSCGTANSASATVTVNATVDNTTVLAATTGGAQVCANYDVATSANYLNNCNLIATVTPTGASPVSGVINACVQIDGTVQAAATGEPYVQRHYNITPATNPATATSTLTLYFLQSEFNAFNTARGSYPALPANGGDATGIANLRITQFNGAGTTPGTYPPGSGTQINPADASIVFNAAANRWEVSFAVTGSGGFYVHTGNFVLPVTLTRFKGEQAGGVHKLSWTTSTETNSKGFELQRSADGSNYSSLGFIATKAPGGNSSTNLDYGFNDMSPVAGNNYYRLKQLDKDGNYSYSNVVVLHRNIPAISLSRLYPNPAMSLLKLEVVAPRNEKVTILVTDLTGKPVLQQKAELTAGDNLPQLNVQLLAAGTYMVRLVCANGCETAALRFVKQ